MSSIRVPDSFPEKDKLQSYLSVIKKIKFYSSLGERLGFGHRVHLLRKLFTAYFSEDEENEPDDKQSPEDNESRYHSEYMTMENTGVKIYKPKIPKTDLLPCVIYFHGGGWTLGSADDMDELTMKIATGAEIIVVSVNYRMAPEHLFPAAAEDCIQVTKYILTEGNKHGIDSMKCAVAGDSAGGTLAAVTAQKLREDPTLPSLKLQVLIYPCLQAVDFNLPSYRENNDDPYLDRDFMISFWLWYAQGTALQDVRKCRLNQHLSEDDVQKIIQTIDYSLLDENKGKTSIDQPAAHLQNIATDPGLREKVTSKLIDPVMSPLLAQDLRNMPETYIVTCQQDIVRDEGILYAKRLKKEGNKVHHKHYNALHAFFDFQDLKFTQDAMEHLIDYIKKTLC